MVFYFDWMGVEWIGTYNKTEKRVESVAHASGLESYINAAGLVELWDTAECAHNIETMRCMTIADANEILEARNGL